MKQRILSTLLFLSAIMTSILAQPTCQMRYYSVADGLAQGNVMGMLQDSKGLMWFSTWNGINKFDGYTFTTYKATTQAGQKMGGNRIENIVESAKGDIWCTTYHGQACLFDVEKELFVDVLPPSPLTGGKQEYAERVIHLKKGVAWIICRGGRAYRTDENQYRQTEKIERYSAKDGNLKGSRIYTVYQDYEGDEWVLTDKGPVVIGKKKVEHDSAFCYVTRLDKTIYLATRHGYLATHTPGEEHPKTLGMPFSAKSVYKLNAMKKDTLALSTDNGLLIYRPKQEAWTHIDVRTATQPSAKVEQVYRDRAGRLWVFNDTPGVVCIEPDSRRKLHLQTPVAPRQTGGRKSRKTAFEDHNGTLWIVPTEGSLTYYDPQQQQLKPLTEQDAEGKAFAPLVRRSMTDRQGNCWILAERGVYRLNLERQLLQPAPHSEEQAEARAFMRTQDGRMWIAWKTGYVRIDAPDGTPQGYLNAQGNIVRQKTPFGHDVYALMQDNRGNIWMGTRGAGLFRLTPQAGNRYALTRFAHRNEDPRSLSGNHIYAIHQDSGGRIWIGCFGGGVNLMMEQEDGEVYFAHRNNGLTQYPARHADRVRSIGAGPDGCVLAGTTDGLLAIDPRSGDPAQMRFYRHTHQPGRPESLSADNVTHTYTDSRGDTYVMCFTGGADRLQGGLLTADSARFHHYTPAQGPDSDLMLAAAEDSTGCLWMVSEVSLARLDPQTGTFECYRTGTHGQAFSFSEAIPAFNARGQLLLGTDRGMLQLDTRRIRKSRYAPPIVFTAIRTLGKDGHRLAAGTTKLELEPHQRNVSVQFAALDYAAPEEIHYAYRLLGLEEEWNQAGENRQASYINLPAGEYCLQVRSTNSDGVWTDNLAQLPVIVKPAFSETPWAWALRALLFVLLTATVAYVLFYIYRLRHRVRMEQQLTDIKLRFFTDISHELRTPLTLIGGPVAEVLQHEPLSPEARTHLTTVSRNAERMLRMMNQILDFRKIQNRKMKLMLEQTDLARLLRGVAQSFEEMAREKEMDYRLLLPQQPVYGWVDRDKLEKVAFNLISNAFKYTPAGKAITVALTPGKRAGTVCLEVSDRGIGIAREKMKVLFQRFETLAGQQDTAQPSSGIGLSMVKELVEMSHGTIEVESTPGEGSRFFVTLPVSREDFAQDGQAEFIVGDGQAGVTAQDGQPQQQESTGPQKEEKGKAEDKKEDDKKEATKKGTDKKGAEEKGDDEDEKAEKEAEDLDTDEDGCASVLVVEDNHELRDFLRTCLKADYNVLTATNGREGLDMATTHLPDLIISDVMMPVMDGLEMVRRIKENADICHIPVIVLSAKSSLDDRIAGLEQGIDDYITKPFSSTYLKTRISSLLQQRKALQEIYMNRLTAAKGGKHALQEEPQVQNQTAELADEQTRKAREAQAQAEKQAQPAPQDRLFMEKVMAFMEEQMDNPDLVIDEFAERLMMSRTLFYQKLKSVVGLSPVNFVCQVRVKRAAQLFDEGEHNISQIAYMTGFNDPKYFSRCFKKVMGMTPSEYKDRRKQPD